MNEPTNANTGSGFTAPDVYARLCRARDFIDLCYDLPLNLEQISSQEWFSCKNLVASFGKV